MALIDTAGCTPQGSLAKFNDGGNEPTKALSLYNSLSGSQINTDNLTSGKFQDAIDIFSRLIVNTSSSDPVLKDVAHDLCFEAGFMDKNLNWCANTMTPNTRIDSTNIACLVEYWRIAGLDTQGTGAPTLYTWQGQTYSEFTTYTTNVLFNMNLSGPNNKRTQSSALMTGIGTPSYTNINAINYQVLDVDCVASSNVGPCSMPCGGGSNLISYTVTQEQSGAGTACPTDFWQSCNEQACPTPIWQTGNMPIGDIGTGPYSSENTYNYASFALNTDRLQYTAALQAIAREIDNGNSYDMTVTGSPSNKKYSFPLTNINTRDNVTNRYGQVFGAFLYNQNVKKDMLYFSGDTALMFQIFGPAPTPEQEQEPAPALAPAPELAPVPVPDPVPVPIKTNITQVNTYDTMVMPPNPPQIFTPYVTNDSGDLWGHAWGYANICKDDPNCGGIMLTANGSAMQPPYTIYGYNNGTPVVNTTGGMYANTKLFGSYVKS